MLRKISYCSEHQGCVTKQNSHNISRRCLKIHAIFFFIFRAKQDRLRREMQEKFESSLSTPVGMKTFRLQPSLDNTSIMKVSNQFS